MDDIGSFAGSHRPLGPVILAVPTSHLTPPLFLPFKWNKLPVAPNTAINFEPPNRKQSFEEDEHEGNCSIVSYDNYDDRYGNDYGSSTDE
jgi:hypothetical protein